MTGWGKHICTVTLYLDQRGNFVWRLGVNSKLAQWTL